MRRALLRTTLIGAGLLLGLLVCEFVLRFFYPQRTLDRVQAFSFQCFEEGQRRWIKLAANKTCKLRSIAEAFPDVVIKTNSVGLRNPEIAKAKPKKTKRIVFIGDSFTMGWGVAEKNAYPRVVESILNKLHPAETIETINAGFTAAGPSGYYLYMKYFAIGLRPDIAVIGFFPYNDITSRLDVEWVKKDKEGLPEVVRSKSTYIDYNGEMRKKDLAWKYHVPVLRNSHLFIFLTDRFVPEKQRNILYSPQAVMTPTLCIFKKQCHDLDKGKAEIKRLFLAMQKVANEHNVKLLFVLIPSEVQVYNGMEDKYSLPLPLLPSNKRYPHEEFATFFTEHDIAYLDLLPLFQQSNQSQLYFPLDDHWNENGHAIAAQAINEKLSGIIQEHVEKASASAL